MTGWRDLQVREQMLLIGAGILILCTLLYRQCWMPFQQYRQTTAHQITQAETQLSWMQQHAPLFQQTQHAKLTVNRSLSVAEVVSQTGKTRQLGIQRIEPQAGLVQVYFDGEQRFDWILAWLQQLQQDFGVEAVTVELEAGSPGFVRVKQLRVGRGESQ